MYYPDEIVEEIRQANDIVDVISSYVKLTKKGSTYFGLCPFHSEKTGSFAVNRQKQMYYCFGCHAGGNVITFIMQYENYTFDEALKALAERVGIKLPEVKMTSQDKADKDLKTKLLEIHKIAANYYYHELTSPKNTAGLDYFHKRKLTDETIRHFGLGYTGRGSDNLYKMLKEKGYDDEILKQTGLVKIEEKGAYDKFWNRVMFPLMDINNKVIGFGGRVIGDGEPKYMNSPETKIFEKNKYLFALNYARKTRKDYFFLCEGNVDVVSMHQAGYTNAVASCGTALTDNQIALIKRYVNKVILTYDSDDAGVGAAQRAIPMLNKAGIAVKILDLSPCKDPDDFLKEYGNEEFDKRVANAENSFLWSLSVLKKKYSMQDPVEKTEFEHKCAEALCTFAEALERDNYTRAVSSKFMIPYEDLKKLVNTIGNKGYGEKNTPEVRTPVKLKKLDEGILRTQSFLLSSIAGNESLTKQIIKYLDPSDFQGELYCELASKVFALDDPGKILNSYVDDAQKMNEAASILANQENADEDDIKQQLATAVLRIKKYSLDLLSKEASDIQTLQKVIKEQAVWKNKTIVLK